MSRIKIDINIAPFFSSVCSCYFSTVFYRKVPISSYFNLVSSHPIPEESGLGGVAMKIANRAVQCVVDKQRSQEP